MRDRRNPNLVLVLLVACPLAWVATWHLTAAVVEVVAWHVEHGPRVAALALLEAAGVLP